MIHYFEGAGALCGESSVRNWTMNRAFVTCAACALCLAHGGRERSSGSAPRLGVKVTSPLRLR